MFALYVQDCKTLSLYHAVALSLFVPFSLRFGLNFEVILIQNSEVQIFRYSIHAVVRKNLDIVA